MYAEVPRTPYVEWVDQQRLIEATTSETPAMLGRVSTVAAFYDGLATEGTRAEVLQFRATPRVPGPIIGLAFEGAA